MSDKDFAVSFTAAPQVGAVSKKPCYLVVIEDATKIKTKTVTGDTKSGGINNFIALDKPDLLNGFIQVKGIYTSEPEGNILSNFSEIVRATPKEEIMEVFLPWHRIHSIRSLVFNAHKPTTTIK